MDEPLTWLTLHYISSSATLSKTCTSHLILNNRYILNLQNTFRLTTRWNLLILMIPQSGNTFRINLSQLVGEKNYILCSTVWKKPPCVACFVLFFWQLPAFLHFQVSLSLFAFSFQVKQLPKQKRKWWCFQTLPFILLIGPTSCHTISYPLFILPTSLLLPSIWVWFL